MRSPRNSWNAAVSRADRLVVVRPQAVEHGVAELVVDDVGRQARVDASLVAVEVVELQRLAGPVVIGVLAVAGMRHHDQPVALERPADAAAEPEAALEEVERVLQRRPDAQLMKLESFDRVAVERRAVRRADSNSSLRSQTAGGVSVLLVES